MKRRAWLRYLPALLAAPALGWGGVPWPFASGVANRRRAARDPSRRDVQAAPVRLGGLHSVTLAVSDVDRSADFYRRLFGGPVHAGRGPGVVLGVGAGSRFLALMDAGGSAPGFHSFGATVSDFDSGRVADDLEGHGLVRVDARPDGLPGPGQLVARSRGGTSELLVGDPHGLVVQLHHPRDCGGAGPFGDRCEPSEVEVAGDALSLVGISHLTCIAPHPGVSNDFYRRVFGLDVQAYQAASPLLGVGAGDDFLMFIGVPGRAGVHHACFTVSDFSVARVQRALEAHGIRPRPDGSSGPLEHWVSMRMPDRGGAPEGTPELYFSDPDGLSIQLQDPTYCGGGGVLGEVCG